LKYGLRNAAQGNLGFGRGGLGCKPKAWASIRIHHLDAGQNLRFESQQLAAVGHFGVPTGGKVLALPAIYFV
jgi:hypothetical protein